MDAVVKRAEPLTPFYCLVCRAQYEDAPPGNGLCTVCGGVTLQVLAIVDELPPNRPASPYARAPRSSPPPIESEGDVL